MSRRGAPPGGPVGGLAGAAGSAGGEWPSAVSVWRLALPFKSRRALGLVVTLGWQRPVDDSGLRALVSPGGGGQAEGLPWGLYRLRAG